MKTYLYLLLLLLPVTMAATILPLNDNPLQSMKAHRKAITSMATSHNGRFIASAGFDSSIHIYDAHSWKLLHSLKGHLSEVNKICFSPDDTFILSVGFDKTMRKWDVNTGKLLRKISLATWSTALDISKDGMIAVGLQNGEIDLYRSDWQLADTLQAQYPVGDLKFAHGGHYLFSASPLIFWDLDAKKKLNTVGPGNILALSVSPNDSLAATAHMKGYSFAWSIPKGDTVSFVRSQSTNYIPSPNGAVKSEVNLPMNAVLVTDRFLVTGGLDKNIYVRDLTTNQLRVLKGHRETITAFCINAEKLVSSDLGGNIFTWQLVDN